LQEINKKEGIKKMSIKRKVYNCLPKQIKEWLKRLYNRYNSKVILDKKLIKDLVEYSNQNYAWFHLNFDEVVWLGRLGNKLNENLWNILNPTTEEEIKNFYRVVPYYIFRLPYWHMERGQRKFRENVVEYSFGDVLDYGGGPGDLSIKLAEKGLNVTYADIQGINPDFARWLFERRGYKNEIEVLDVEKDEKKIWMKEYDTIVCIDVIEHIPHPESILEKMAKHLRKDGRLIITQLKSQGPVEDAPMHFEINFNETEKLLDSLGVFKSEIYDWLWIKESQSK
jgi:SAM-dependent methyltransferase